MAPIAAPIDGALIDVSWAEDITNTVNSHTDTLASLSTAPVVKIKPTIETINNVAVLQSDDHLFWDVGPNQQSILDLVFWYTSGTTADFKFDWTYPSGTTFVWGGLFYSTASVLTNGGPFSQAIEGQIGGLGSSACCRVQYAIATSSAGGVLQMKWAQLVATVADTSVHAGSFGILFRLF